MVRRRYRQKHWIELVWPLGGLFLLGCWYVPQFRALAAWALVAATVALVAWVFLRVRKQAVNPEPALDVQLLANLMRPPMAISSSTLALTADLVNALEWRAFEILVTLYFREMGHHAKRRRVGADDGVDIELLANGGAKPFAIVQCKAWHLNKVGVRPVRELFGVMAAEQVTQGYFVTSGDFTM